MNPPQDLTIIKLVLPHLDSVDRQSLRQVNQRTKIWVDLLTRYGPSLDAMYSKVVTLSPNKP